LSTFLEGYKKYISINSVILLFVIGLALFVRLYGVSEYDFTNDELWHLTVSSQQNIWEVIKYNFQQEVHPPLSYIIWHLALQISNDNIWLRMPGIIAGVLLIPSMYLFGKLYIGRYAGCLLAFIFAFAPLLTAVSVSIRAYSLMMLFLVWAAIYVHKYCSQTNGESRRKSLILYSIFCFTAIELHHAACFVIFSLGLILIAQSIKEKNKKDFIIISAIHAILISLILGYLYILTTYYGFEGLSGYFTIKTVTNYVIRYMAVEMIAISGIGEGIIDVFSILALIVTPIFLIKHKKYCLLNIVVTPLAAIIICDYFDFYPFSPTVRNNLFLFLSVSVIYAYFAQLLADAFSKNVRDIGSKKLYSVLRKVFAVLLVILVAKQLMDNNFSRNIHEVCKEFTFTKKDRKSLDDQLKERNKEDNIFVTVPRNMWHWRFTKGNDKITILTDHLAKFEDKEIVIYFDAAYGISHSIMMGMADYQIFFRDLFEYLNKKGDLSTVKSFTFFDTGLNVGHISLNFHPQFIPTTTDVEYKDGSFASCKSKTLAEYREEAYNLSWVINTSDQVLDRFFHTDTSFLCGRNIYVLRLTPKFVKDEILDKNFLDFRKLREEKCGI